jgi:hypothetical protein
MRTRLLWYLSPALALSVFSETVAQYLLAQSKALPIMASSLVGLTLSPLLYWGAVFWWVPVRIRSLHASWLWWHISAAKCRPEVNAGGLCVGHHAVFWRVPMAPWQAAVTLLHSRTVVAAMA